MSEYRVHKERTTVEGIGLPGKIVGRGVMDVRRLCDPWVTQLREYFKNRTNISLYDNICRVNLYTSLKLAAADLQNIGHLNVEQLAAQLRGKQLHIQHSKTLDLPCMDSLAENRVIKTRNYQKHILSTVAVIRRPHLYGEPNENIEHIRCLPHKNACADIIMLLGSCTNKLP